MDCDWSGKNLPVIIIRCLSGIVAWCLPDIIVLCLPPLGARYCPWYRKISLRTIKTRGLENIEWILMNLYHNLLWLLRSGIVSFQKNDLLAEPEIPVSIKNILKSYIQDTNLRKSGDHQWEWVAGGARDPCSCKNHTQKTKSRTLNWETQETCFNLSFYSGYP